MRPGTLSQSKEPRLIFIEMLTRPIYHQERIKRVFVLRKKFNEILNAELVHEKYFHIMKVKVETSQQNFDIWGNLTGQGKWEFWSQVNDQIKKFERKETDLLPMVAHEE